MTGLVGPKGPLSADLEGGVSIFEGKGLLGTVLWLAALSH